MTLPIHPDVVDLVADSLSRAGFDGLYSEDGECACTMADGLAPCGKIRNECRAGYMVDADPDSEHDYIIQRQKPALKAVPHG